MRVAAIVVTFNRRDLLLQTLAALEAQDSSLEHIYVIDNASTDDTWETLQKYTPSVPMTRMRLKENTGGAGGFFTGMDHAYEGGYDAFWVMDDDTIPRPDALRHLVNGLEEAAQYRNGEMPSYAGSMVVWKDGNACFMNFPTPTWDWMTPLAHGKKWMNLDCTSFVSCLVTREAVEECGLPYPEYFIWFDDAEYTYRLSKWRSGIFVPASIADHMMGQNTAVFWGEVTEDNFWKFSKGARNQVAASISLRRLDILASVFQGMVSQMRRSPAPLKLKLRLARAALSGLAFRPKVRYPRSMLRER
ncbi:MAG: glycosyl transferase [Actinobacteria bacterium]|nr:MAG: glycosyl transferase [Actinomycetota bacterium]